MDENGDDIFDQLLTKQNALKLKILNAEIQRLEREIADLQCQSCVTNKHFDQNSLQDGYDQRLIVIAMKKDFSDREFEAWTRNLESLFLHVDNIRYAYKQCGVVCPDWYNDKYLTKVENDTT